nr:hypothetical protein [Chloroflexota bacterium]
MATDNERMRILQMIEDKRITAAEGLRLLNALTDGGEAAEAAPTEEPVAASDVPPAEPVAPSPAEAHWRGFWRIPMGIGIGITVLAGIWMYAALQSAGMGFWFYCAWAPFLLGVAVMALAAATRRARWLHVRVNTGKDEWPRNIAISLPVPIGAAAWLVRVFGWAIPPLQRTAIDDLIAALDQSATPESPLFVDVTEGDGGERVQVYLG